MFKKVKTIKMYDTEIELRKVKVKEAKELLGKIENEINNFLSNKQGKKSNKVSDIIVEKLEFIRDIILQFTNIDVESFNELYVSDIWEILKQLIEFNGINLKRVIDFFTKILGQGEEVDKENFMEEIPQL